MCCLGCLNKTTLCSLMRTSIFRKKELTDSLFMPHWRQPGLVSKLEGLLGCGPPTYNTAVPNHSTCNVYNIGKISIIMYVLSFCRKTKHLIMLSEPLLKYYNYNLRNSSDNLFCSPDIPGIIIVL